MINKYDNISKYGYYLILQRRIYLRLQCPDLGIGRLDLLQKNFGRTGKLPEVDLAQWIVHNLYAFRKVLSETLFVIRLTTFHKHSLV